MSSSETHNMTLKTSLLRTQLILYFLPLYQMVPLHVAAEAGRHKIVGFLFGAGVDINMKDYKGVGIYEIILLMGTFSFELWLTLKIGTFNLR